MQRLHIPGVSLTIVEGDRIVHLRGFGKSRRRGEAPNPRTPFFIGSLTKSFTALAVMQLVEAGQIELDATVQRYLPWFKVASPKASSKITIRHLLHHTSGLPMLRGMADLGNMDNHPNAAERQVQAIAEVKLAHPVGAKFEYSNTNYNILGLIIEAASGETYPDYIQKYIFNPLDMHHSFCSKTMAQRDGLTMGYRYWFGYPIPTPNLSAPLGSLAAGQLISSSEDMAHYLIANLNGGRYGNVQILSEAGMAELHKGRAPIKGIRSTIGTYGMGWIRQQWKDSIILSHSGIVPDFSAYMALLPDQKKGIILLINANHAMMKMTFDELGMGAAKLLTGKTKSADIDHSALWLMSSMMMLPVLQFASIIATLKLFSPEISQDPVLLQNKIGGRRRFRLLLYIFNLLPALTLLPLMGKMRGFIKLFMPDFAWIALACASFAGLWTFLHSILFLRARKNQDNSSI